MNGTSGRDRRLPFVALSYTALALAFTWPLAIGLGRDVPGDLGDSLLNMWILAWGAEHIPRLLAGATTWTAYWNGSIFHPEPYALALSEHLFAQALQITPLYALTGNIILCYNLLFLSTFVLGATGAYLLVRDLTGDWRAGVIAGLVFGFLPYRIAQIPHLQVLSAQWMPFALWGVHRFVAHRAWQGLAAATAALVLQNWSCGYYVLYFTPLVAVFAVHEVWRTGRLGERAVWFGLAAAALVTTALTLPFLLPYLRVQEIYAFERPYAEVRAFSANVWSYATAAEAIHLWGRLLRFHLRPEGETFLGVGALLLAAVALWQVTGDARAVAGAVPGNSGWRRALGVVLALFLAVQGIALLSVVVGGGFQLRLGPIAVSASAPRRLLLQVLIAFAVLLVSSRRTRAAATHWLRHPAAAAFLCALLAAWLSLGPEPAAGPSPLPGLGLYDPLYRYVPGFTGLRVPARYAMVAGLFLAILAGFGAARLARRANTAWPLAIAGALVVADAAAMPLAVNARWSDASGSPPARILPAAAAPRVYHDVRALPAGTVVVEFPFGEPAWELRSIYYASVHGKPVLNGYSGAFPPEYSRRVARLRRFAVDDDAAWQALTTAGTTHAIVRTEAYPDAADAAALLRWLQGHGATLQSRYGDGAVLLRMP